MHPDLVWLPTATSEGLGCRGTGDDRQPSPSSFSASACSDLDSDGIPHSPADLLPPTAAITASSSTANADWESRPPRQTRACAKLLVRSGLRCGGCFDYRWHCQCKITCSPFAELGPLTSKGPDCNVTQAAAPPPLPSALTVIASQVPANAAATASVQPFLTFLR